MTDLIELIIYTAISIFFGLVAGWIILYPLKLEKFIQAGVEDMFYDPSKDESQFIIKGEKDE